jgi:hypothetical protein
MGSLVAGSREDQRRGFWRGAWLSSGPAAAYAIAILSRGYEATLASFQDDASYYFVIAEHVVRTQRSTFDGVTATNGYHPLWFALNLVLVELSHLDRHTYVTALVVVCAALTVVHGALLRQLVSALVRSQLVADVIVLLVILRCLPLAFCGMECGVAMPLLAGCALLTWKLLSGAPPGVVPLAALGMLVAITGLARLDAVLFGLACVALVLFSQRGRGLRSCAQLCAACWAGLSPFIAYLSWNWATQGALLTTSARSKMLALGMSWNWHLFDQMSFGEHVTFLYVPLAAAALLSSPWAPWRGANRRVAFLIFLFPVCYYASIALRSSWLIWIWYLYPLPLCMAVGLAALSDVGLAFGGEYWLRALPKRWALALAVPVVSIVAFRVANKPRANQGVLDAALRLGEFTRQHPVNTRWATAPG